MASDMVERGSTGPAFLLKIGNGEKHPAYTTVAGLRMTALSINGQPGAVDEVESTSCVTVSATGIFTGHAAETRVKSNALSGLTDDYELSFEGGERFRGRFLIARLDYVGERNGERNYGISLESSRNVEVLP